jgi:hypothetical protein
MSAFIWNIVCENLEALDCVSQNGLIPPPPGRVFNWPNNSGSLDPIKRPSNRNKEVYSKMQMNGWTKLVIPRAYEPLFSLLFCLVFTIHFISYHALHCYLCCHFNGLSNVEKIGVECQMLNFFFCLFVFFTSAEFWTFKIRIKIISYELGILLRVMRPSFRSDLHVGWKKIKTNIQNSTPNSWFDALLKWHNFNIYFTKNSSHSYY